LEKWNVEKRMPRTGMWSNENMGNEKIENGIDGELRWFGGSGADL